MFAVTCTIAFAAIFKSYPSISDTGFYIPLLCMHQEIFKYAPHSPIAVIAILFASLLGPLFYNLWVYIGSGNANFFYAITLVFSLGQVVLIVDLMYGYCRREWERLNPGWRKYRIDVVYK